MGEVLVEAECITSTAADIDYYEAGRVYTIDMVWAKARDIWRHFRPLREVSAAEAEDRIRDEILPARENTLKGFADANEEAEAKLMEAKLGKPKGAKPKGAKPKDK